jgi:hypothetical protein
MCMAKSQKQSVDSAGSADKALGLARGADGWKSSDGPIRNSAPDQAQCAPNRMRVMDMDQNDE